jgi:hypothetical protein
MDIIAAAKAKALDSRQKHAGLTKIGMPGA